MQMFQNISGEESRDKNMLVSVFWKKCCRISIEMYNMWKLQSEVCNNLKVDIRTCKTWQQTFQSKFVVRMGFIVKTWYSTSMFTVGQTAFDFYMTMVFGVVWVLISSHYILMLVTSEMLLLTFSFLFKLETSCTKSKNSTIKRLWNSIQT